MKKQRFFFTLALLVFLVSALSVSAFAYKNQWVTKTDGSTYYYGSNGKPYTYGPKKIKRNGKTGLYLFDAKGKLVKNQVTYIKSRKRFYVSQADGTLLTSLKKFRGRSYCGCSEGYLKLGLQYCSGRYMYFNPSTGYAMRKVWKKVGKYYYYFNSAGKAYKNRIAPIGGSKYYFDAASHRCSGVRKVGKYYYGFHATSGKMQYGLCRFNGKYYYFNTKTGRAVTNGFQKVGSSTYYFNASGVRQSGWLVLSGKRYYLDPKKNGAVTYGTKKINGTTCNFGTKGYVASGVITVRVNRKNNVVTVYDGTIPVKAMACSTGKPSSPTPVGTFTVTSHHRWWMLDGPSWGQYCSHFLPSYLFHSVPMYSSSQNPYAVNSSDFNKLGSAASAGCVRLCVADAKWIYDNVPIGSTVVVSDSAKDAPMPLGKPSVVKMAAGTIGKDPTDIWS